MDLIVPHLWLGNSVAAADIELLKCNQITCVISVLERHIPIKTLDEYIKAGIRHNMFSTLVDCEEGVSELAKIAPTVQEMLSQHRRLGQSVLLHCQVGASRSAACMIYHLMHEGLDGEPQSYHAALAFIRYKRPCVDPNIGFRRWLQLNRT